MHASISWLDHDPKARERSLRILALFQQKETRDELGLGSVRDAIADTLFPGTSTLQTRLRYFLFVPWILQSLEQRRVPSARFADEARRVETDLIKPLVDAESTGVLGSVAGKQLKTLPSSVYWAGLGAWNIRQFQSSQAEYIAAIDDIAHRRRAVPETHHDEQMHDAGIVTWYPRLPPPPDDFPHSATFELTSDEAVFLLERIEHSHPDCLLAHLARYSKPSEADFPWQHPDLDTFSEPHRSLLDHARYFAETMQGAALLYNLMLAEQAGREALATEHAGALERWHAEVAGPNIERWSVAELWDWAHVNGHRIPPQTQRFVSRWFEFVRAGRVGTAPAARDLVRNREMSLKGPRSRFRNQSALDQWSGRAGLSRLSYRWGNTRRLLDDLYGGLGRAA